MENNQIKKVEYILEVKMKNGIMENDTFADVMDLHSKIGELVNNPDVEYFDVASCRYYSDGVVIAPQNYKPIDLSMRQDQ